MKSPAEPSSPARSGPGEALGLLPAGELGAGPTVIPLTHKRLSGAGTAIIP